MKSRSIILFCICIFINLLIGNLALLIFPELDFLYRIVISIVVFVAYGTIFFQLDKDENQNHNKWKLAGLSILLSLFGMLAACIFTSIGTRLPMDNLITAGLKGIVPLFIFSIVFASPFWIPLAIVNFVCLIYMKKKTKQMNSNFIFPYSTDKEIKRRQLWKNLQSGLLFEDNQVFIPWLTPYSELDKYAEDRKDSGDRTNWFLGKHKILDGFESYVGVMKWLDIDSKKPFGMTDEFLGSENNGYQKFLELKEKLTDLLGEPTSIELEKYDNLDLGHIEWTNGKVSISLSGIEQFACKYRLYIGLKDENI
ncbi:MAG: hypothetical protein KA796_05520 [Chryseobacterium sp.]|nr:hypothetical protein [Chryseobacterium sp.]MBP7499313.1 hypothetical protein [Chryseobacterium sp.]